jgi:hypothetical protein
VINGIVDSGILAIGSSALAYLKFIAVGSKDAGSDDTEGSVIIMIYSGY